MTDITVDVKTEAYHGRGAPHLDQKPSPIGAIVFFCLLAAGLGYGIKGPLDDTSRRAIDFRWNLACSRFWAWRC